MILCKMYYIVLYKIVVSIYFNLTDERNWIQIHHYTTQTNVTQLSASKTNPYMPILNCILHPYSWHISNRWQPVPYGRALCSSLISQKNRISKSPPCEPKRNRNPKKHPNSPKKTPHCLIRCSIALNSISFLPTSVRIWNYGLYQ